MRGKEDYIKKVKIHKCLKKDGLYLSVTICTTSNQKRIVSVSFSELVITSFRCRGQKLQFNYFA
jgi:hypothetical protein